MNQPKKVAEDDAQADDISHHIHSRWKDLIQEGQMLVFGPDQILFYQGHFPSGVFVLGKGKLALEKVDGGVLNSDVVEGEHKPIIGLDYLLTQSPYPFTAKTLTKSEVCFISKSLIFNYLSQDKV